MSDVSSASRARQYLETAVQILHQYKHLAEQAAAQVSDTDLLWTHHPDASSIATIMKHLAGNMRSRWSDFLTADGEKRWRDHLAEFTHGEESRDELLREWDQAWGLLFSTLESLTDEDLSATVVVYGKSMSAMQAIQRQLAHYCYHVGQVVYIARLRNAESWKPLSQPHTEAPRPH